MDCDIGDTFWVRANWGGPDDGFFWDIWANVKELRGLRIGVYGAHVSTACQQDCSSLLPSREELRQLQDYICDIVVNECGEETREDYNDLALQCLMAYNELYYRLMEAAARHQ